MILNECGISSLRKVIVFMSLVFLSGVTQADWLVKGAEIVEISNTAGNNDLFYINVKGGVGMCADAQIRFPIGAAGSERIFDRAFSLALTAYASGSKVNVYDYDEGNESCFNAESIRLIK